MRKMVVFDMDNTLLQGKFIDSCAKKYNFRQALALLRNIDTNSISLTKRIGSFLKGKPVQELVKIADEMPLVKDVAEVIEELKQRNYIVGIISDSYEPVTDHIAKKIGADFSLGYELARTEDCLTGDVSIPSYFYFNEDSTCEHPVCKTNALRHICSVFDVSMKNTIVLGSNDTDLCMLRHAGLGISFASSSEVVRSTAGKRISTPAFKELLEFAP